MRRAVARATALALALVPVIACAQVAVPLDAPVGRPEAVQHGVSACGKRADILRHLGGQYREQPVALGLADDGTLLEVLSTADGATWTLLRTQPNGTSCLIATGQHWQLLPQNIEQGEGI